MLYCAIDVTVEEILIEGGDSVAAIIYCLLRAIKLTVKAQKSIQAAISKAGILKNASVE